MNNVITRIGDKNITNDDLITYLKLSGNIKPIISELAMFRIVRDYFKTNNMEIPLDDLQRSCDLYRASLGLYKAEATEQWLQKLNIGIDDFERFVETDLMTKHMKKNLASSENIDKYFEDNKSDYDVAVISHIVVTDQGQASLILTEINDEGEKFEDMAKKHSINIDSGSSGGYLGPVRRKNLNKEISDNIFNAQASEIIGPIETEDGFELIRIEEKTKALKINDEIKTEIANKLFMNWLKEQKDKYI